MANEQEEEGEEKQPLPEHTTCKDAFTALSLLDCVIHSHDADEKIVKAMDEIQDPEYKIYKKLFEAKIY
jgi:hypothetical protein